MTTIHRHGASTRYGAPIEFDPPDVRALDTFRYRVLHRKTGEPQHDWTEVSVLHRDRSRLYVIHHDPEVLGEISLLSSYYRTHNNLAACGPDRADWNEVETFEHIAEQAGVTPDVAGLKLALERGQLSVTGPFWRR